ncbi:MAG: integration host factor, actinobacterial type [Actinomycetota bacterium]|jgi:hypothetical protein|nr:integration host factor, actinobacterial type [Actinomycetota bacterium]
MAIPLLSNEEKRSALEHAREIRKKRSEIKKGLKSYSISFIELFEEKNKYFMVVMDMKILDLMKALPGFGDIRVNKILQELQISPRKKFKGLGQKQKSRLLDYFCSLQDKL